MLRSTANPSLPVRWLSLYLDLVRVTLEFAIFSHAIIGSIRLLGFNVFRGTYKPLLAESVIDFWNRFNYYFKELLADFFFFPVYLRYFKTRVKTRIFAAVFAAAFAGNMYAHALDRDLLLAADFDKLGQFLAPRTIYCLVLATGIYVSMLRQQRRRGRANAGDAGASSWLRRQWRRGGVWTFYSLIHIWNLPASAVSTADRWGFFASLWGIEL
jgi:hypothetical protein